MTNRLLRNFAAQLSVVAERSRTCTVAGMPPVLSIRKGSPPWHAPELARALARISDDILLAVCAVDGALRAELDTFEVALGETLRVDPSIRLTEQPYSCKNPHRRIGHNHDLLCIEAPHHA